MPTLIIGMGGKPKGKMKPSMGPPPNPFAKKDALPPAAKAPMAAKPKMGAGAGVALGDEKEAAADGDETLSPVDVGYGVGICRTCAHMGEDGMCVKYKFPVEEEARCIGGYEAKHEEAEGAGEGVDAGELAELGG